MTLCPTCRPAVDMVFTNDTFEIFSYAAEARGSALGVQTTRTTSLHSICRIPH